MSVPGSPVAGMTAGSPRGPLVLPPDTVIHMIAFAGHDEACKFVGLIVQRANRRSNGSACKTIVTTGSQFTWAAQAQVDVLLVSAHGPASEESRPVLGDARGNYACLTALGRQEPFCFGARAGIAWDACYSGQPTFRSELARLSAPGVVHIAPAGEIRWNQSMHMGKALVDELLAPGVTTVTAGEFAAAAARAAASSAIELWHGPLGREGTS
jgi:hypothetical protein